MADRGAAAGFLTEIVKSTNSPCYLLEMYLDYTVNNVALDSGGSGYAVGNIVSLTTGTYNYPARAEVTSVSGGVITGLNFDASTEQGAYSVAPSSPSTTTAVTGTGTGATIYPSVVGGPVRLSDAWRDIDWGGNTFTANGDFLDFSGLVEALSLQIPTVTIVASAINQDWIAIALNQNFLDRRCIIYKGFVDYSHLIVTSPISIFDGRLDTISIADAPDNRCSVSLTATNQFGAFDRRAGRHTNSTEQQIYFSGDLFFDYCAQLNVDISWGKAKTPSSGGTPQPQVLL